MAKSAISRQFREVVLVPEQGGTGTICLWWYGYQGKVVPVPLTRTKVVPVLRKCGNGTNIQNRVGISTNQNGIGTTASYCPYFGIHALLSSNSHTEGIGTLINY